MGYMFRYNPAFELCFRAVREGWLGKIFAVEAVMGKKSGDSTVRTGPIGGTMFELGCHVIDAVVYLLRAPAKSMPFNARRDRMMGWPTISWLSSSILMRLRRSEMP